MALVLVPLHLGQTPRQKFITHVSVRAHACTAVAPRFCGQNAERYPHLGSSGRGAEVSRAQPKSYVSQCNDLCLRNG